MVHGEQPIGRRCLDGLHIHQATGTGDVGARGIKTTEWVEAVKELMK